MKASFFEICFASSHDWNCSYSNLLYDFFMELIRLCSSVNTIKCSNSAAFYTNYYRRGRTRLASYRSGHNFIFNSCNDFHSSFKKTFIKRYYLWSGEKIMSEKISIFRKIFRRVIWENLSTALILIGVFMLMQPFAMWMYSYSFIIILVGTIGFIITSHFPD